VTPPSGLGMSTGGVKPMIVEDKAAYVHRPPFISYYFTRKPLIISSFFFYTFYATFACYLECIITRKWLDSMCTSQEHRVLPAIKRLFCVTQRVTTPFSTFFFVRLNSICSFKSALGRWCHVLCVCARVKQYNQIPAAPFKRCEE
jgi:hypothetical protein